MGAPERRRLPWPTVPACQAVLLAAGALVVTGCASGRPASVPGGSNSATGSRHAAAVGTRQAAQSLSPASGCAHSSGFALSLASGYSGWATPVLAAQQFSRQADPPGFGTPTTIWTAGAATASGVRLTAGHLSLHAVRLPNGRWAIDSGQRCD
ncbi:MAG: hypothetical protein JO144_10265 [Actinobacteria bacterium]|nr:hypothetical protein [Actinomycetota bacterium]